MLLATPTSLETPCGTSQLDPGVVRHVGPYAGYKPTLRLLLSSCPGLGRLSACGPGKPPRSPAHGTRS